MIQTIVLMIALLFGAAAYVFRLKMQINQLQAQLITARASIPTAPPPPINKNIQLEPIALEGAGQALKAPPTTIQATLDNLKQEPPYSIPLGWYKAHNKVFLQTGRLVGDINHILISGQSDAGKDNAALNILLSLALTHTPQQVNFAIIDGKGLDWMGWQEKAHAWHVATDPEQIGDAMARLTAERQRRRAILAEAKATKWDHYQGGDLPMLVVFISELLLLENAVGSKNLTSWLNAELTAARAFGIRYIIATQNASNFSTQWRSQISLCMAGFQPLDSSDAPNTTMTAKELAERKLVAPSKLPSPSNGAGGVFVLVQSGDGINVRTSLISDQHRDYCLNQLPNLPKNDLHIKPKMSIDNDHEVLANLLNIGLEAVNAGATPTPSATLSATGRYTASQSQESTALQKTATRSADPFLPSNHDRPSATIALPFEDEIIPFTEQRRIIEAARSVSSRRQLCTELYNTTGGVKFTWVKNVCDALGLLQTTATVGK
jgi:DNA segregation ATPase FtsK/SpoIIIE, S-DNA-T family